ncbi:MAG: 8-oxo-dGTP pyrophosphatase MutT (NUDIX family) [Arenicella sp.]|jgi:8-oxo-dGTP pyrophosphatase MutT (NUDIX family)
MLIGASEIQRIRDYQPRVRPQESVIKAAVSIILRDGEHGTELLMMQRAKHENDPWSGQMSFPGGKIEREDADSKAAAVREAFEEVGAELTDDDFIGQLDDLYGLKINDVFSVHIACFVFKPQRELDLLANYEVADMVWLPISVLDDRANAFDYKHPKDPALSMPAVMIDQSKGQILWGLSLRMLANLHELLEWPMQVLTEAERGVLKGMETRKLSRENADKITKSIANRGKS